MLLPWWVWAGLCVRYCIASTQSLAVQTAALDRATLCGLSARLKKTTTTETTLPNKNATRVESFHVRVGVLLQCSVCWPQTCCVSRDDLKLVVLLPSPVHPELAVQTCTSTSHLRVYIKT